MNMPMLELLVGLSLAAAAPNPHALVDSAIAAMQRGGALRDVRSLRLTGIQHEYLLGNAERAEGPWRTSYSTFTELRDATTGATRRAERGVSPTGVSAADRITVLSDTFVAYQFNGRESGAGHNVYEDMIDRIDGAPDRALRLASAASSLTYAGTVKHYGLTFDVVSFPWRNGKMNLEINRETHLPDAVVIERTYPDNFRWDALGLVTMRHDYVDWNVTPSGIYWPMQTKVHLNGELLRDISLSAAALDATPPAADSFAISDSSRAQFVRNTTLNFSHFKFGVRGQPVELVPGVVRVPDQWAMTLIKQPDGVVIFEAHISPQYFRDVVAEVNRRWPGSRIKAVVMTSDPWAHLGGYREVVAEGIPIYVSSGSIPFLTSLTKGSKAPRFLGVSGKTTIGTGANRIELYPVGGPYAERMLMAYLPDHKLLYGADLVFMNRGADGKPSGGFLVTPAEDLRSAVAREKLDVDKVFCVQNYGPFPWSDFTRVIPKS
jgi:hypothetical protein